ncbi:hypothetical protein C1646_775015, partial [Rhizophagus diaphanus]
LYEWCQLFEAAFAANGWPDNRKVALATGFLKEAVRDWYKEDKANINHWHVNNNANNFDTRLIEYFATPAQRNQNCQIGRNNNNGNNRLQSQRPPVTPINYANDKAEIYYDEYEDEYEEEWEEEDEYEAYVTT